MYMLHLGLRLMLSSHRCVDRYSVKKKKKEVK